MLGIAIDVIVAIGNAKEVEAFTFRKSDDFAHRIVGRIAAVAGMKVEITLHPDPRFNRRRNALAWRLSPSACAKHRVHFFTKLPETGQESMGSLAHIQAKDLSVNGNPAATNTTSCATLRSAD
jgi:hypothetical protein